MLKLSKHDFKRNSNNIKWYDIYEDWNLIEASFQKEYGIRLRQEVSKMSWGEFCSLLSAISEDTPLGNIVRIRSEDDREHLKYFTSAQRELRTKWRIEHTPNYEEKEYNQAMANFEKILISLAGGKR